MKNIVKCFEIIAIVAAIIFTLTACGDDPGGGKITGKVQFRNGAAPNQQSMQLQARSDHNIMPLADTSDFTAYTNFYNTTLGGNAKLVRKITPTSFKVANVLMFVMGEGGNLGLEGPLLDTPLNQTVDFAQNITLSSGEEIFVGTYDFAYISFHSAINTVNFSSIEFSLPDGKTETVFDINRQLNDYLSGADNPLHFGAQYSNGKITAPLGRLFPNGVRYFLHKGGEPEISWGAQSVDYTNSPTPLQQLVYIAFAGDSRKLVHITGGAGEQMITQRDVLSSYPETNMITTTSPLDFYVIPFPPVIVDEDENISAVRFEIYWDLTDLIEQYSGADGLPDTADDIFVLRNGWWEALSFRAVIEY